MLSELNSAQTIFLALRREAVQNAGKNNKKQQFLALANLQHEVIF
jgi:hypothetical protein